MSRYLIFIAFFCLVSSQAEPAEGVQAAIVDKEKGVVIVPMFSDGLVSEQDVRDFAAGFIAGQYGTKSVLYPTAAGSLTMRGLPGFYMRGYRFGEPNGMKFVSIVLFARERTYTFSATSREELGFEVIAASTSTLDGSPLDAAISLQKPLGQKFESLVSILQQVRINEASKRPANQALLPTTTAVTPPAAQEPRQP